MRIQRKLFSCFIALVTLLTVANSVLASCPTITPGPPCLEFPRADAVFIGLATRVVREPNTTSLLIGPYTRSTVYFTIEEAFKGVSGTALVMELDYCGHAFKENERYLVYARRNPNNKELDVRAGNSRTRPLADAKEDLDYIRGLSSASPETRVFGKVIRQTHNIKESGFYFESLPNIRVTLVGNNEQKEITTDSAGKYEFKGVAAGTYRLRAELPAYLDYREETIKVKAGECAPVDIQAWRKAQIGGRVLDVNGKPLVYVPVSLVSADATAEQILAEVKDKVPWTFSLTNEQGRFRFQHLAPGRYLLVINRADFEKSRGETWSVLPRLFYPGVNDLAAATVIVITEDGEIPEYNFHLAVR
jgi:carboxypeptidase family protein